MLRKYLLELTYYAQNVIILKAIELNFPSYFSIIFSQGNEKHQNTTSFHGFC